MGYSAFTELASMAQEPEALERTVEYLAEHLHTFLRKQERVLICFPNRGKDCFGWLLEQAVRRVGGIPQFWGPDFRWKALLRQAFSSRATVIAGTPLVVLGLMKLARATATPLYIHKVLLSGHPGAPWILDGIQKGLDCRVWGCYCPGAGPVVAGFACHEAIGMHLRTQEYTVQIVNEMGEPVSSGQLGRVTLTLNQNPSRQYLTKEWAKLETEACPCGNPSPRLRDMRLADMANETLFDLQEKLLTWPSILDYQARRTEFGLELEVITLPVGALPKLPSCAKLLVRSWNPERDMPFSLHMGWSPTKAI